MNCFVFVESQPPRITASPPSPLIVKEGQNITLKWTYSLSGAQFFFAQFGLQDESAIVRKALGIITVKEGYNDRISANISDTSSSIMFLPVNRNDTGKYRFEVHNIRAGSPLSNVDINVQCK